MYLYQWLDFHVSFALVFSFHRRQWATVIEELCRHVPPIVHDDVDTDDDDDDDGYGSPAATENWDEECIQHASFLEHKKWWAAVMTELGMIRPLERIEWEMLLNCNAMGEPRQQPANLYACFLQHQKLWPGVMREFGTVMEMKMLLGCNNARCKPLQRPTKLLDRRGRSLPSLNFH